MDTFMNKINQKTGQGNFSTERLRRRIMCSRLNGLVRGSKREEWKEREGEAENIRTAKDPKERRT